MSVRRHDFVEYEKLNIYDMVSNQFQIIFTNKVKMRKDELVFTDVLTMYCRESYVSYYFSGVNSLHLKLTFLSHDIDYLIRSNHASIIISRPN